jgi:hypothetical protein
MRIDETSPYRPAVGHPGHVDHAARAVSTRLLVMLAGALVLANVHLHGRPTTVCLLRATTGIPCPLCGGTTAAARVGAGDLAGALRASPLAVLAAPVVALVPALRPRLNRIPPRVRVVALLGLLAGSEFWQLHRFGLV